MYKVEDSCGRFFQLPAVASFAECKKRYYDLDQLQTGSFCYLITQNGVNPNRVSYAIFWDGQDGWREAKHAYMSSLDPDFVYLLKKEKHRWNGTIPDAEWVEAGCTLAIETTHYKSGPSNPFVTPTLRFGY